MDLTSLASGSLRLSASGRLPVDAVWERYTHPAWWPVWAPHLREVHYPDAVISPGTTGRVTGVGGVVAVFRIDAVDHEARTWSWSVRSGPVRVSLDHGVDPPDPGSGHPLGCTAWLVTRALWPVALGYAPVARWSLQRLVTG
ncbi:hypothetical protein GCM10023168_06190 [Fodinibacter luteus]|uniref:SRPBCC family protein n=1 Tax=Fodinibacter luteus TaxID=552064 RepID=A0ABP8K2D9_9MICO